MIHSQTVREILGKPPTGIHPRDFDCNFWAVEDITKGPTHIRGDYICPRCITTLHNIHKHIKEIHGTLLIPFSVTSNMLGVILIKRLQKISFESIQVPGQMWLDTTTNTVKIYDGKWWIDPSTPYIIQVQHSAVENIINKHLQGDRDIHAAQEELIDAGLDAYARV